MQTEGTLLLRRSDVEGLLSLRDCIDALEEVFRLQGQGKIPRSEILGVKTPNGGLHVKAGLLPRGQGYIVAKLNTNFPVNRTRSRLPTIQGLVAVCDAENGAHPLRHPPVRIAEEFHQGRYQEGSDDCGVEDDPGCEADRQ